MKRMNQRGSMLATVVMIFALFIVLSTTITTIVHRAYQSSIHDVQEEQAYLSASSVLREIVTSDSLGDFLSDASNHTSFAAVQNDSQMGTVTIQVDKNDKQAIITSTADVDGVSKSTRAIVKCKKASTSKKNNFAAISVESDWLQEVLYNNMDHLDVQGNAFYTVHAIPSLSWTNVGNESTFSQDLYLNVDVSAGYLGYAVKLQNATIGNDLYVICDSTQTRSTLRINISNCVIGGNIYFVSSGIKMTLQGTGYSYTSLEMSERFLGNLADVELPAEKGSVMNISSSGNMTIDEKEGVLKIDNSSSANVTFETGSSTDVHVYRIRSSQSLLTLSGDWMVKGSGTVVLYVEDNIENLKIDSPSYDCLLWGIQTTEQDNTNQLVADSRNSKKKPQIVLLSNHAVDFDLDSKDYIRAYVYTKDGTLRSNEYNHTVFYGSYIGASIECAERSGTQKPLVFISFDSSKCPTEVKMLATSEEEESWVWEVERYE